MRARLLTADHKPYNIDRGRRNPMIVLFMSIYAISVYHHESYEFEPRSLRGVLDATLFY